MPAVFVMRLLFQPPQHSGDPGAVSTILLMLRENRLRQTLGMTMAAAFAVAALPVVAVSMAPQLGVTAAFLTVVYGSGNTGVRTQ